MSGNTAGGLKTVAKVKAKDPDHYKKIGSLGGKASGPQYQKGGAKASGFARNPELAAIYGAKGGSVSRRKSQKKPTEQATKPSFSLRNIEPDMTMQPNPAML